MLTKETAKVRKPQILGYFLHKNCQSTKYMLVKIMCAIFFVASKYCPCCSNCGFIDSALNDRLLSEVMYFRYMGLTVSCTQFQWFAD